MLHRAEITTMLKRPMAAVKEKSCWNEQYSLVNEKWFDLLLWNKFHSRECNWVMVTSIETVFIKDEHSEKEVLIMKDREEDCSASKYNWDYEKGHTLKH